MVGLGRSACGFFELCLVAQVQGACNACATQLVARPALAVYMPASGFFCWGVANWFVEGKPGSCKNAMHRWNGASACILGQSIAHASRYRTTRRLATPCAIQVAALN